MSNGSAVRPSGLLIRLISPHTIRRYTAANHFADTFRPSGLYILLWRYGFLLVCYSNFVPKMHSFWDIRLQKCRDLENWVKGPSRSLKMSSFDRAHMTSYWRSIVNMAISLVVSEIFNVDRYRDLEITVRGQSRSLKVVPFDTLQYGFLLVFYSNFVPKTHHFWDIRLQKGRDLENRFRGPSKSLKMSPFDRAHMISY